MDDSSDSGTEAIAASLVAQFDRMVRRDGGAVSLLGIRNGDVIEAEYRPGAADDCDAGACAMPHVELQELMSETLRRRAPRLSVALKLAP